MRANARIAAAVTILLVSAPLHAQTRADAIAIIDKAIKAHGGEEALARAALAVRTGGGVMTFFGKDLNFTDEVVMNLPDRIRVAAEIDRKFRLTMIVNGDKGWQALNGQTSELPADRVAELRDEAYVLWLATVVPLKQEGLAVALLPDVTLRGNKTNPIKVAGKSRPDAIVFFDKETGLLAQISRKAKEAGLEVEKDYQYVDFKVTDGGKLPARIVEFVGGKKFSDLTSVKYQFLRKPDETMFAKP